MNHISCEVIKDLLPLYHDGICSSMSKALVEEHLAECESCTAELDAMDMALPTLNMERNLNEAEAVQKLSRKWKKNMFNSAFRGAISTLIGITIILLFLYLFIDFRIVTF